MEGTLRASYRINSKGVGEGVTGIEEKRWTREIGRGSRVDVLVAAKESLRRRVRTTIRLYRGGKG